VVRKLTDETEEKVRKSKALMNILDIPYLDKTVYNTTTDDFANVCATDLYDILMDEEKLRVLVSKLRNKAFW
jgi:hypothetical protein